MENIVTNFRKSILLRITKLYAEIAKSGSFLSENPWILYAIIEKWRYQTIFNH